MGGNNKGIQREPTAADLNRIEQELAADSAKDKPIYHGNRGNGNDGRFINDSTRLYLSQMREQPLLTREEEIVLAKRIEQTRYEFMLYVFSNFVGISRLLGHAEAVFQG